MTWTRDSRIVTRQIKYGATTKYGDRIRRIMRKDAHTIKSTKTTVDILETIQVQKGATLTEVAEEIDLTRSTVHDYLQTLVSAGYLIKEDKRYNISLKLLDMGYHAKVKQTEWELVRPALREIGDETGEHAWFVVEENGKVVYVDNYSGRRVISLLNRPGTRHHIHCTAAGKAILANLPEERVEEILKKHGLPAYTERTLTNRSDLLSELEEIRESGVAFADGEWTERIRAVASPVIRDEEVIGAVTLGAPTKRLSGSYFHNELPQLVTGAVSRLEISFRDEPFL